jgi:diguanylate cyclase (GGDEF)-like protein
MAREMNRVKPEQVPADVYVQFVRSLYDNVHMILIGAFCHAIVAIMSYLKTGAHAYLWMAFLMAAMGAWRFVSMRRVVKTSAIRDYESAKRCEADYILKGSIQGLTLGTFCFIAIYLYPDPYAELAAVAVTMGSMVTVAGRNYGSPRMVAIFSLTFVSPIAVGLLMRGDMQNVVLGLLIIPFFFIISGTAKGVREVLFSAVIGHRRADQIAQRFDRALNTMSSGLIMLSPEGRVVVANAEAARLMSVKKGDKLLGRTLRGLLMRGVAGGILSLNDSRYAETQLTRALREGKDRKVLIRFSNGRYFEFSAREGHDELGVITFDEVTARIEAEERIRFMARYDSLTGLANRAYFHEMVCDAVSTGDQNRSVALAVFDLDDFKSVNDTLGHPVGDGLIYAVAERLNRFAGEDVKVSRFGGDEFMIFFNDVKEPDAFGMLLDDIFASLNGDVDVAGHALRIQSSAGAVLATAKDADVDAMIVKADLALYKAKENGKNGWRLFEAVMDQAFRNRQVMKADLRHAVETGGLRVVYQPIVSMETMRIVSCEALCRWDHPEIGPISPSVFIPLAEEMGIVSEISTFMLNAATTECVKWPTQICVSVNLSAKDFRNDDIIAKVSRALDVSGLAPQRLEIEVTETALLDDKSQTRTYIEKLKRMGVRIALDDFGTGYSSLSYLHTLPLDKVKIDRSFLVDVTRSKRSLELLSGIVSLSRLLGLTVTIEGVETFEQLKVLSHDVKPELVQGFLFGSALTASGIEAMSNTTWPFASQISTKPAVSTA